MRNNAVFKHGTFPDINYCYVNRESVMAHLRVKLQKLRQLIKDAGGYLALLSLIFLYWFSLYWRHFQERNLLFVPLLFIQLAYYFSGC